MLRVIYNDILVGKVLTNMNLTIDEALYIIGFDEVKFISDNSLDGINYNEFKLVH